METVLLYLWFHSQKQEEVIRGQIRWLRRVGDYSCVFSGQKYLHSWSVLVRCCGIWTSCGSATVPAVLGGVAPLNIAEPPISNAGYPFGLEEQIFEALALKVTCVGIAWVFTSFSQFPYIWIEKVNQKSCCFGDSMHFRIRISTFEQSLLQMPCLSKSAIRKSQIVLYVHNNKYPLGSSMELWLPNSPDWCRR